MNSKWNPLPMGALAAAYRDGSATPAATVRAIARRIAEEGERPTWIATFPAEQLESRAAELERDPEARNRPLYGIPFAVKDNIDVAGLPTTAACPGFAYAPGRSAAVVDRLTSQGAMVIGKTNMDQFATGLVGARSPYGACSSVFNPRYISGGSSSGSAVAVASGLACFALGTDTAGSGRVPAAFNNLIGLKPTRGAISMSGVVPACRSVDCVSIFATNAADAFAVSKVSYGYDSTDAYSREFSPAAGASPWASGRFRFGVPRAGQLEFFGDVGAAQLWEQAIKRMEAIGGEPVEIDFTPFREAAELLYSGPWVAERLAAIEPFLTANTAQVQSVVGGIIRGGARFSAVDTWRALYRLEKLKQETAGTWTLVDVLMLPTTPTTYTIEQVEADPIRLNTNLGYYTNFVNLMDLAAVAAPAGFRPNGLPFGVSLIGGAFSDQGLLKLARDLEQGEARLPQPASGCIPVAVLGAHLTGQPLNRELTSLRARLVRTCRTAPDYRFYHLRDTTPPKPGLVREPGFAGPGIEVEVWAVPERAFGTFVAGIPAPLGIGTVTLEDDETVKCFICEPWSLAGSREITEFGGWRKYMASLR